MKCVVLDTVTGKTETQSGIDAWQWAENNWSCDCNRVHDGIEMDGEDGVCFGSKRFLVIDAINETEADELRGYSLEDLNQYYPKELLQKHGIIKPCHAPT